jgi:hypothetical protein
MISLKRNWDTLIITLLITLIFGGSSGAVKIFTDNGKVVVDENAFYKQLIDKDKFAATNPLLLPTVAIINSLNKTFFNKEGQLVKDVSPTIVNQSQGPYVYQADRDKALLSQEPRLNELVPIPLKPEKYNHLYYPRFEVNANIVYAGPFDYDIIDEGKPCSIRSMSTPIQKLVREGIVHIYGSPLPGELRYDNDPVDYYGKDTSGKDIRGNGVGSSYIVGHSSECTQHAYTKIFEPLQQRSSVGDEFYIFDQMGRKLKFVVFEVKEVGDRDTASAYKKYDKKRVVTLQTSVFYTPTNIKRWLTVGELVL